LADRSTEILNYLSAMAREVGEFRQSVEKRFNLPKTDLQEIKAEVRVIA